MLEILKSKAMMKKIISNFKFDIYFISSSLFKKMLFLLEGNLDPDFKITSTAFINDNFLHSIHFILNNAISKRVYPAFSIDRCESSWSLSEITHNFYGLTLR